MRAFIMQLALTYWVTMLAVNLQSCGDDDDKNKNKNGSTSAPADDDESETQSTAGAGAPAPANPVVLVILHSERVEKIDLFNSKRV